MQQRTSLARLTDIVDAIELIRSEMAGVSLQAFEPDKRKRWLVERGIEIISEASRHLISPTSSKHAVPRFLGQRLPTSGISSATTTNASPTTCFGTSLTTTCRFWKEFAARRFLSSGGSLQRERVRRWRASARS